MQMQSPTCPKSGRQEERGQSLIEMAIIMPLVVILMAGVFDFGRIIHAYVVVVNAARESAIAGAAIPLTDEALTLLIEDELLRGGVNSGTATPTFEYIDVGSPPVQTLRVTLNYEIPMTLSSLIVSSVTVRSQAQIPTFW